MHSPHFDLVAELVSTPRTNAFFLLVMFLLTIPAMANTNITTDLTGAMGPSKATGCGEDLAPMSPKTPP